jgi:hypothetical protein
MKFSVKTLLLSICVIGLLAGCDKGEDAKPLSQQQLGKLVGTWELTSANDGDIRTADFPGVELTLSGTFNKSNPTGPYNYSFTGTFPNPSPWSETGTWNFVEGSEQNTIEREDEVLVTYTVSGSNLTLNFTYNGVGFPGGPLRSNSVNGDWTFEFTKN